MTGTAPPSRPNFATARIIAVDDQPANILVLERAFRHVGHHGFEGYTEPADALAAIRRSEPDLLLLDLHMPGIDGFAMFDLVRSATDGDAYLPVVILTADSNRETRREALRRGATDFLTKPFDLDEVVLRSRNLLDGAIPVPGPGDPGGHAG